VNGPLYPFGYGLSYTSFQYNNLVVSQSSGNAQASIEVSVDILNTGNRKGDEVVRLYIKDVIASVTTYEFQLRGFERVSLEPREKKTVNFLIQPDDLALLDRNMNWTVEPGEFEIWVGSSSTDIRLKKTIVVR
jgi:beta-glucosidase